MVRIRPAVGAVVPQQQVAILFAQSFDTPLQTAIFQLDPVGIAYERRHGLRKFLSQVFEMDLVRDAEEITGAVAVKLFFDLFEFTGDAVDGFVGEVFRFNAAATGEDLDQATANFFVFQCGLFAIGIEPGKQRIESLL